MHMSAADGHHTHSNQSVFGPEGGVLAVGRRGRSGAYTSPPTDCYNDDDDDDSDDTYDDYTTTLETASRQTHAHTTYHTHRYYDSNVFIQYVLQNNQNKRKKREIVRFQVSAR